MCFVTVVWLMYICCPVEVGNVATIPLGAWTKSGSNGDILRPNAPTHGMAANVEFSHPCFVPHILILSRDQPPPRPATFTRSSHGRYCTSIPRPCCLMTAMVEALDRAPTTTPACRPPCARGALARPATSTACPAGCSAPQQRTNRARLLRPTLGISAVTAPGLPLSLLLLLLEVRTRRSHRWWDWRRRPPA